MAETAQQIIENLRRIRQSLTPNLDGVYPTPGGPEADVPPYIAPPPGTGERRRREYGMEGTSVGPGFFERDLAGALKAGRSETKIQKAKPKTQPSFTQEGRAKQQKIDESKRSFMETVSLAEQAAERGESTSGYIGHLKADAESAGLPEEVLNAVSIRLARKSKVSGEKEQWTKAIRKRGTDIPGIDLDLGETGAGVLETLVRVMGLPSEVVSGVGQALGGTPLTDIKPTQAWEEALSQVETEAGRWAIAIPAIITELALPAPAVGEAMQIAKSLGGAAADVAPALAKALGKYGEKGLEAAKKITKAVVERQPSPSMFRGETAVPEAVSAGRKAKKGSEPPYIPEGVKPPEAPPSSFPDVVDDAAYPAMRPTGQAPVEAPPAPKRYHGTSQPISKIDEGHYETLNIYGQGFYTTDAPEIAKGYTKKGKGKEPTVYEVSERNPVKFYDMEATMTWPERKIAEDLMGWDEMPEGISLRGIMDEFRESSAGEMMSADTVQETFEMLQARLEELGYGGFKYVGGKKTGKPPHDVRVYWHPERDVAINSTAPPAPQMAPQAPPGLPPGIRAVQPAPEAARGVPPPPEAMPYAGAGPPEGSGIPRQEGIVLPPEDVAAIERELAKATSPAEKAAIRGQKPAKGLPQEIRAREEAARSEVEFQRELKKLPKAQREAILAGRKAGESPMAEGRGTSELKSPELEYHETVRDTGPEINPPEQLGFKLPKGAEISPTRGIRIADPETGKVVTIEPSSPDYMPAVLRQVGIDDAEMKLLFENPSPDLSALSALQRGRYQKLVDRGVPPSVAHEYASGGVPPKPPRQGMLMPGDVPDPAPFSPSGTARIWSLATDPLSPISKKWNQYLDTTWAPRFERLRRKAGNNKFFRQFVSGRGADKRFLDLLKGRDIRVEAGTEQAQRLAGEISEMGPERAKAVRDFLIGEPSTTGVPVDEIRNVADRVRDGFAELGERLSNIPVAHGGLDKKIFLKNLESYLPRYYEAFETVKAYAQGRGMTIRAVLDRIKRRKDLPEAVRKALGEIEQADYIVAKGMAELHYDVETLETLAKVAKEPDWASAVERPGWIRVPDEKNYGALRGMYVPPSILGEVRTALNMKASWMEVVDKSYGLWKMGKTVLNPATHARNMMSNTLTTYQATGLNPLNPAPYGNSLMDIWNAVRNGKESALYREFKDAGGFAGINIDRQLAANLLEAFTKTRGSMVSRSLDMARALPKKTLQRASELYNLEDKWFRFAGYTHMRNLGYSVEDAARFAMKATPDYRNVSAAARGISRMPFVGSPFFTFTEWAAKTLPEQAFRHPLRAISLYAGFKAIESYAGSVVGMTSDQIEELKGNFTGYMKNGTYLMVPVKNEDGTVSFLDLTYILPLGDFMDVGPGLYGEWGVPKSFTPGNDPLSQILSTLHRGETPMGRKLKTAGDYFDYVGGILLPPLTPVVGTSYKALQRSFSGTPEYRTGTVRSPSETLLSAVGGLRTEPVSPAVQQELGISERVRGIEEVGEESDLQRKRRHRVEHIRIGISENNELKIRQQIQAGINEGLWTEQDHLPIIQEILSRAKGPVEAAIQGIPRNIRGNPEVQRKVLEAAHPR